MVRRAAFERILIRLRRKREKGGLFQGLGSSISRVIMNRSNYKYASVPHDDDMAKKELLVKHRYL